MFFGWKKQIDAKKIAVFVDSENMSYRYMPQIMKQLNALGKILLIKVYVNEDIQGGWKAFKKQFPMTRFILIDKLNSKQKNAADLQISLDISEHIHHDDINTVSVVSSDSDFYHIVKKINEKGIWSVGFGKSNSTQVYQEIYSQFVELELSSQVVCSASKAEDWTQIVTEIIKKHSKNSGFLNIKKLTNIMRYSFNINAEDLGYKSWSIAVKDSENVFKYKTQSNLGFVGLVE